MKLQVAVKLLAATTIGLLALSACSSSGGKRATESETQSESGTKLKIAMISHAAPGDSFWDIVQKGAQAAAVKDNVQFLYSSDLEGGKQAQLVRAAIDQKVDGIVITLAKPDALKDVIAEATKAGIPVVSFNSGADYSAKLGILAHFGQNEKLAGQAAGNKLTAMGIKNAICVIHEQGNVGLDERCAGAKSTFGGTLTELYVQGTNAPQVKSTITAKLQADKNIDGILTLGAAFADIAVDAARETGSHAKVGTFDLNKDLISALENGSIQFAVDQQPFLQGYQAIDQLWLFKTNGNVLGGGQPVLTGPSIITKDQVATLASFAERGTR